MLIKSVLDQSLFTKGALIFLDMKLVLLKTASKICSLVLIHKKLVFVFQADIESWYIYIS